MSEELQIKLETAFYAYNCGNTTAQQLHKEFSQIGFTIDLRQQSYSVDVLEIATGHYFQIEA